MSTKPFKKIIETPLKEEDNIIKPFKTEPTGTLNTDENNTENDEMDYDSKRTASFGKTVGYFSTLGGIFVAMILFILVVIVSNTIQTISDIMIEGSLAQYLYLAGLLALLFVLIFNIFGNLKQILSLQKATQIKEKLERQKKQPTKEIVTLANALLKRYEINPDPKLQQNIALLRESINAAPVYSEIYYDLDSLLLPLLDEKAKKIIHKASLQAALSTAISPIPLFDMLLILWRSMLLSKEIALLYGFRPGGLMRVILLKKGVVHIAFAGVTELATDLANKATSASVLAKISESAAQGIANGVLLSRLGYGIMDACRPITLESKKSNFTKQLVGDIAKYLKIYPSSDAKR